MKLVWHPAAVAELDGIVEYVRLNYAAAPVAAGKRVPEVIELIKKFPDVGGHGLQPGTREMLVGRLPFVIVYLLTNSTIEILHVLHTSQHRR